MEQVNSIAEMDRLKKKNKMLLVYFGGKICSVCQDIMPKIDVMIERYPFIKAVKIEMQQSPELSANYDVFTVPVVMLFIQGKETIREAGIISLIGLEEKISRYYTLFYGEN
jgi:thioredoxin-like negative regulator of GroEL